VRTPNALAASVELLLGHKGLADADTDPEVCDERLRSNFAGFPYTLEVNRSLALTRSCALALARAPCVGGGVGPVLN